MTFLIIMYSFGFRFNEQDIGPELLGRPGLETTVGMIAAHTASGKQTARQPRKAAAPMR
jgi:hypothetical protein